MYSGGDGTGDSLRGARSQQHQAQHQPAGLAPPVPVGALPPEQQQQQQHFDPQLHQQHQHQQQQQHQQHQQGYAAYQQWLPAQFGRFQLGGGYLPPHHHGAGFYPPPPALSGGGVLPGSHHGGDLGQQYAGPPHVGPLSSPHPSQLQHLAQTRGWGGMQVLDQPDSHHGAYGATRNRGGPNAAGGGRGGGEKGRGQGRGRRGRVGPGAHWVNSGEGSPHEVLLRIKRLPQDAPIDDNILQALQGLGSRGLAVLTKELGKSGLPHRAVQLCDRLRALPPNSDLGQLLDEFSFTAMISNCVGQQDLSRAMALAEEMRERGVERNVHTFSALMNVCIKCGQYKLALDVYRDMQAAGCLANVVTFNTLIDVYGKSGLWEDALSVLEHLKREGIQPVTRTYNTLMIACNTSNQWQEALRVYDEMAASGLEPNTTTYNALISAHSKGGDLPKVLQVFKEMVHKGCERSVITYSSLISACEKAGEWQLALQLFEEMRGEGLVPNVISYNSLITACAQGAQWEQAAEVFEQMQRQGCRPDVVTFTALIQAYERGGQWRRALAAFEEMRCRPCAADSIVYNAIIDVLWETGVAWAQRRAVQLFRQAAEEGLIRPHSHACADSLELNLHSTTAGVALLSLHCWLHELDGKLKADGADSLPDKICIVAGKGKAKDSGHSIIKESITALLRSLRAPFKESADSTAFIGRLEASGQQVAEWMAVDGPAVLSAVIPECSESSLSEAAGGVAPAKAAAAAAEVAAPAPRQHQQQGAGPSSSKSPSAAARSGGGPAHDTEASTVRAPAAASGAAAAAVAAAAAAVVGLSLPGGTSKVVDVALEAEIATESRVAEAFKTVKYFEETHCLNLQVMSFTYIQQRSELIALACSLGLQLALPDETVYDAVLLLDRAMSVPLTVAEGLLGVTMTACLAVAAEQSGLPAPHAPALADVARVSGVLPELLSQMRASVLTALSNDTSSISALRCLKLYLERISGSISPAAGKSGGSRSPLRLLLETLADAEFLNYRPSVVAAAVLFVDRRSRGLAPYWPSALRQLTGYHAQNTPEFGAAVSGAQRLHDKLQLPAAVSQFQAASYRSVQVQSQGTAGECDRAATAGSAPLPPTGDLPADAGAAGSTSEAPPGAAAHLAAGTVQSAVTSLPAGSVAVYTPETDPATPNVEPELHSTIIAHTSHEFRE